MFVGELVPLGGRVVHGVESGPYAPGYVSALWEDPDGIRLEVNYVPSKGLLGLDEPKLLGGYEEPVMQRRAAL